MASYDPITDTKVCPKCGLRKSGIDFNKRKNHGQDPYAGYCRYCANRMFVDWSADKVQHLTSYARKRRAKDPAKFAAYDADRHARPEVKKRLALIKLNNEDRYRSYHVAARCRKKFASGSFTESDIQKIRKCQKNRCAVCRQNLKCGYHIDHIQPLAKGGSNFPWNLQLLCPSCNWRKSDTDPVEFMQKRGFLL